MTGQRLPEYTFSYTVDYAAHPIHESPSEAIGETVPVSVFATSHAPLQALVRYLIDARGKRYAEVARILGRSQKTVWASYHQSGPLPTADEETLRIPLSIFATTLTPLESLVAYLRRQGLRNSEIATTINRDPRTTWTVFARGEAKR